jgi:hypothetical protein
MASVPAGKITSRTPERLLVRSASIRRHLFLAATRGDNARLERPRAPERTLSQHSPHRSHALTSMSRIRGGEEFTKA